MITSNELLLPEPKPTFTVGNNILELLRKRVANMPPSTLYFPTGEMDVEIFIRKFGKKKGRETFKMLRPVLEAVSDTVGSVDVLDIDCANVKPNTFHRSRNWHQDGYSRTILVSDALPTSFAVGKLEQDHPVAKALKIFNEFPGPRESNVFSEVVDRAITDGDLDIYKDSYPLVAYDFTRDHLHRSQPNQTHLEIARTFLRFSIEN